MEERKSRKIGIFLIFLMAIGASFLLILYSGMPTGKVIWMEEGDEIMALDSGSGVVRAVKFFDVAGENRTPICGFLVDGEHIWVEEGRDNELKGIKIYVRKVVVVRDQLQDKDVCKVAFANTLIMVNESEVFAGEETEEENETEKAEAIEEQEENEDTMTAEAGPVQEGSPSVEEKPAKISLFARIMGWLRNII